MNSSGKRDLINKLVQSAEKLDESQLELLYEAARSMQNSCEMELLQGSDILPPAVGNNLKLRLQIHHALHFKKLDKKPFEFAFCRAWEMTGAKAELGCNPTFAGADITINGQPFSLKTETAQSKNKIKISKLMEARWIRECRTGNDFLSNVKNKVVKHLKQYNRIITLRTFETDESVEYEVIEIPRDLLLAVNDLKPEAFSPRTENGSSSAEVIIKGQKAFRLRLDGSVEKVTVENLLTSLCIKHGSYKIKLISRSGEL